MMRVACFCGAVFEMRADVDVCPACREFVEVPTMTLEDELDRLVGPLKVGLTDPDDE